MLKNILLIFLSIITFVCSWIVINKFVGKKAHDFGYKCGKELRQKIDMGFWDKDGNYKEDFQEIDKEEL